LFFRTSAIDVVSQGNKHVWLTKAEGNFEIGRILHLKPETRNGRLDWQWLPRSNLLFRISGFEMQDLSNFQWFPWIDPPGMLIVDIE